MPNRMPNRIQTLVLAKHHSFHPKIQDAAALLTEIGKTDSSIVSVTEKDIYFSIKNAITNGIAIAN
jgi:hypothetical protein